jgi:hypothetical protein
MSALLTTTMPYMKVVIDTLKEKGIRDDYIVLVGGAPLNEEFGKAVGADAYCRDAAIAVETAKSLIARAPRRRGCAPEASDRHGRSAIRRAGHRLRRAGARDRRAAPAPTAGTRSTCSCLPPELHNRPEKIPAAVREADPRGARALLPLDLRRLRRLRHRRIARRGAERGGVERLPGAHCYEFFATAQRFAALAEAGAGHLLPDRFPGAPFRAPGAQRLGIDRHPELIAEYFRNYRASCIWRRTKRRAVERARAIAARLGSSSRCRTPVMGLANWRGLAPPRAAARAKEARMASLIIISWRDIPAQVIVKRGRETAKVQLSHRFQEAVDRAAMRAGKGSSAAYLADWKRSAPRRCGDDLKAEARPRRRASKRSYSDEDLER